MKKLKVLWLCSFNNKEVASLEQYSFFGHLYQKVYRRGHIFDYGQWVTNAIQEIKQYPNIELHVVRAGAFLKGTQHVAKEGIHYHFFTSEDTTLYRKLQGKLNPQSLLSYEENYRIINSIIESVAPDIIHVIGAENASYAPAILTLQRKIPVIVSLQTFMNAPGFKKGYAITDEVYNFRADNEKKVICRADYIGMTTSTYIEQIRSLWKGMFKPINITLALTEPINISVGEKRYDFVYFAGDINKAADHAIEAFALANREMPGITLDIVGKYEPEYKQQLDQRLQELGLQNQVFFEGRLPNHADVIHQIRLARFALLPLKVDLISGTVREAMANGLPLCTTITPDTPSLNKNRESVLLSPIGDFQAMARNMLSLLNNADLAECLRKNAGKTAEERDSNKQIIKKWVEAYYACIDNYFNSAPFPPHLIEEQQCQL